MNVTTTSFSAEKLKRGDIIELGIQCGFAITFKFVKLESVTIGIENGKPFVRCGYTVPLSKKKAIQEFKPQDKVTVMVL